VSGAVTVQGSRVPARASQPVATSCATGFGAAGEIFLSGTGYTRTDQQYAWSRPERQYPAGQNTTYQDAYGTPLLRMTLNWQDNDQRGQHT